jgi:hypothetical protein
LSGIFSFYKKVAAFCPSGNFLGSSQESVQNFVVKIPQNMLNQLNLKALDEMP